MRFLVLFSKIFSYRGPAGLSVGRDAQRSASSLEINRPRQGRRAPLRVAANRTRARCGFTVVELLVVIGILAILISLLLPTISRVRAMADRTRCLTNLRTLAQACAAYAGNNQGYFPITADPVNMYSRCTYSFDLKDGGPEGVSDPQPSGLGLLISGNFISQTTAPKILHDSSMDDLDSPYPGHCMDVAWGTNPWGTGATWFTSDTTHRIIGGYTYREMSYMFNNRALGPAGARSIMLKNGITPSNTCLIADQLDPRFGRNYTHHDGYNFVRLDGSGQWWPDKSVVEQYNGSFDGVSSPGSNELVFAVLDAVK